jgi:hypothetical protein
MNNKANYVVCILFCYNTHKFEESNIINNSQGTSGWGIIENGFCDSSTTSRINKCCLIKNSNIYLFYVGEGKMEVRECTIQSGYKISKSSGYFYTYYRNSVAVSECAAIKNCCSKLKYKSYKVKNKFYKKFNNLKLNL